MDVEALFFQSDAGVASGVGQPTPVGVRAVPRGFDEKGVAYAAGDFLGVLLALTTFDDDFNEFGHFLAITDDLLGEGVADEEDCVTKCLQQFGIFIRCHARLATGE